MTIQVPLRTAGNELVEAEQKKEEKKIVDHNLTELLLFQLFPHQKKDEKKHTHSWKKNWDSKKSIGVIRWYLCYIFIKYSTKCMINLWIWKYLFATTATDITTIITIILTIIRTAIIHYHENSSNQTHRFITGKQNKLFFRFFPLSVYSLWPNKRMNKITKQDKKLLQVFVKNNKNLMNKSKRKTKKEPPPPPRENIWTYKKKGKKNALLRRKSIFA